VEQRDLPKRPGEQSPDDVSKKGGTPAEKPNVETPTDTPKKPGGDVKVPTA
jgi:hypothetical protein